MPLNSPGPPVVQRAGGPRGREGGGEGNGKKISSIEKEERGEEDKKVASSLESFSTAAKEAKKFKSG